MPKFTDCMNETARQNWFMLCADPPDQPRPDVEVQFAERKRWERPPEIQRIMRMPPGRLKQMVRA